MIKKWWKYSSIRFYILNFLWNLNFMLHAKKIYRTQTNQVVDLDNIEMDYTLKLMPKKKTISSRRFSGYMFRGKIYHDNPGIQGIDYDTWIKWKKKKLID